MVNINILTSLYFFRAVEFFFCSAHYFCLLFAPGLGQGGADEEGIKGFLPNDILKEWRRGARLKCQYCEKKYGKIFILFQISNILGKIIFHILIL